MGSAIEPNRGFRRASRSSRGSDMECIEPRLNAKLRLVVNVPLWRTRNESIVAKLGWSLYRLRG